MAHKKGVGSSKNGRESESKRLGIKLFGGEFAKAGNIIVRQRGTVHHPGINTGIGKDHTIYALIDGTVIFRKGKNNRSYISIQRISQPVNDQEETKPKAKPVPAEVTPEVAEVLVDAQAETTAAAAEVVTEKKPAAKPKAAPKAKVEAKPKETKAKTEAKPAAKTTKKTATKKEEK